MFSLLWSLICYQSIYKYHVINREMRNSKGDFQYFLPLSAGLCSYLPAASNNEKIVQTFYSFSLRKIHLGYGIGDGSIRKTHHALGKQKYRKENVFLGLVKSEMFSLLKPKYILLWEEWIPVVDVIFLYIYTELLIAIVGNNGNYLPVPICKCLWKCQYSHGNSSEIQAGDFTRLFLVHQRVNTGLNRGTVQVRR